MKPSLLALAFACSAAIAGEADPSGQFALTQGAGPLAPPQDAYAQSQPWSPKTREQVKAEYLAGREQARALTSEDSGSAYLAQSPSARSDREYMARANPRLRNR